MAQLPFDIRGALPLLEAISWYDARPRDLDPREMLSRYEAGWRHRGVLADPSDEELELIRWLIGEYDSFLRV